MFGLQKNIDYLPAEKHSPWRKIAGATWSKPESPQIYAKLDIDASHLLKKIETFKSEGQHLTATTFVAKATAMAIKAYPMMNSVLRFGHHYQRKSIDIFLQVAPSKDQDDLTGMVIRQCDEKSLSQIAKELKQKSSTIKKGNDTQYKAMKKTLSYVPAFLMRPLIKFTEFLMQDLNLWHPWVRTPKNSFGSAMVTSVGMFDIDFAFAPLISYSRCPMIVTLGTIRQKAVVVNDKVCVRPMLPLCLTVDHRFVDGKSGSLILKTLREHLEK